MKYQILIQPEAEAAIVEAFGYIHADSPANAARWLQGLYKKIGSLEMMPRRCAPARENGHFPQELRQLIYKSHRIIFEVEGETVRVLHVRHTAQRNWGS